MEAASALTERGSLASLFPMWVCLIREIGIFFGSALGAGWSSELL